MLILDRICPYFDGNKWIPCSHSFLVMGITGNNKRSTCKCPEFHYIFDQRKKLTRPQQNILLVDFSDLISNNNE